MRRKDDQRRILHVYAFNELTDGVVHRAINIQQGACRMVPSLARQGRPEEVSGAVSLSEHGDKEIPLLLREQPSGKLPFSVRAGGASEATPVGDTECR